MRYLGDDVYWFPHEQAFEDYLSKGGYKSALLVGNIIGHESAGNGVWAWIVPL